MGPVKHSELTGLHIVSVRGAVRGSVRPAGTVALHELKKKNSSRLIFIEIISLRHHVKASG